MKTIIKAANMVLDFTIGALGALYIVTDLAFEFGIEYFELKIKQALGR